MPPCVQYVNIHYSCISWQCDTSNRTSRHINVCARQRPNQCASRATKDTTPFRYMLVLSG